MTLQEEIGVITLLGLAVVTLAFVYVVASAGKAARTAEEVARIHTRSGLIRRGWFWFLIVFAVGAAWASLKPFPIPPQFAPLSAAQVVDVQGQQWSWTLSSNQVEAGTPVEFRVTSIDVNHSFALYAPDGQMVIQTQAMPGYTNKLLYTFQEPGDYTIRCLEYCGLAHSVMATQIEVIPGQGEQK